MKLIPLTQGKFAKVDDEDFEYLNRWKWHAHCQNGLWYARANVGGGGKRMLMHQVIFQRYGTSAILDHVDRDGLNNTRVNLRSCTYQQNAQNRKMRSDSKVGFKGVHFIPAGKNRRAKDVYLARISTNNGRVTIGSFDTPEDAARAYDEKAKELFGEFARVNFP